jgi:hypothetical protein
MDPRRVDDNLLACALAAEHGRNVGSDGGGLRDAGARGLVCPAGGDVAECEDVWEGGVRQLEGWADGDEVCGGEVGAGEGADLG